MALIKCPECGKEISDKAKMCIYCGYPIDEIANLEEKSTSAVETELGGVPDWNSVDDIFLDCKNGKYIKIENGVMTVNICGNQKVKDIIYNFSLQYYGVSMGINVGMSILNVSQGFYTGVFDIVTKKRVKDFNRFKSIMEKYNLFQGRSRFSEIYRQTEEEQKITDIKREEYRKVEHAKAEELAEQNMLYQERKLAKQQENIYKKMAKCPRCGSTSLSYDTKKLSIGRAFVGDAIAGAPGAILGGLSSKKGYAVCLNCGKRWKI